MKEPTNTSQKQKPGQSSAPEQLTPQEIESLKQDAREAGKKLHELWKENPLDNQNKD